MILTDDEIRKAAEFAAEQMWPESGYVGWTEDDAVFHRKFVDALLEKLRGGVELPEAFAHAAYKEHPSYEGVGDIVYYHPNAKPANCIDLFTRDQLLAYGAAQRLAGREQVLKEATDLDWTAIMCEGCLVTWENAETLGCHAVEHIRALAASPQEQT